MIQSLIIRIVEHIPTIKALVKRLITDPSFKLDCGFFVSDIVPSEAYYTSMLGVISQLDVMDSMEDTLTQTALLLF